MAVGKDIYLESDGKAVDVDLTSTVTKGQLAYVDGWLGITNRSGDSGDSVSLSVDNREYQWEVPSNLSVSKGDIVYVDVTDLTGHSVDSTAYSTTSDGSKKALFKATADKDTNNIVTGIMLAHAALVS